MIPAAPVAFMVFNRPEKTRRVFEAIRRARPSQLFVVADGPRTEAEKERCRAVRAVVEGVDWPCEVHTNFSETNLGCKQRIATGISWVFEHTDRAIFLEDDCVPEPSFFPYCEELLERYKDDERVMHISGDNVQSKNPAFSCEESYYFSLVPLVWGWATWRRAWQKYDVTISLWPEAVKKGWIQSIFADPAVADRWQYLFRQYAAGAITSWDGQWSFACFVHHGLSINPTTNLVMNVGFDQEATHGKADAAFAHPFANIPTGRIEVPLIHPRAMVVDARAEAYAQRDLFEVNKTLTQRVLWFAKQQVPHLHAWAKRIVRRS